MEVLKRFISHVRDGHATVRSEKSQTLVSLCNVLLHDLNDKVNSAIETYKLKLKALVAVTPMVKFLIIILCAYSRQYDRRSGAFRPSISPMGTTEFSRPGPISLSWS